MKQPLIFLLLLMGQLCLANMASPIRKGTLSSSAFSSRDIDILGERISVVIDKRVNTASYVIEYSIRTEVDGQQVPLLFHAQDYLSDFKVFVDDAEVQILNVPSEYIQANSPFEKFSNSFSELGQAGNPQSVKIYWSEDSGNVYSITDLKYFEMKLSKGEHNIRVAYTAEAWQDRSSWVSEYSFRYSLSPAKFWKSFGSLEINISSTDSQNQLTTNLGQPTIGQLDSVAIWTFKELPASYFQINYIPSITSFAETMLAIGPIGLTAIFGLVIAILHLLLIFKFKKDNPQKRYSWVLITGSVIIPLIVLVFYIYSFDLIDDAIGTAASRYHGYTFLVMIFYPVLAPFYGLVMWLFSKMKFG